MKYTPHGIYTAVVTPFTHDDQFDEAAYRKVIDFQISSGIHGLLVIGGSGEFVSLTTSERQRVVEVAVEHVAGRVPVMVGALAPGSREVIATVRHAEKAGADAALVLPPYYIKPSPDGIFEHFSEVAGATDLPIVAYNNTGRTGIDLNIPLLEKLATIPSIVSLKECERDLGIVAAKIAAVGDRIAVLSGDDDLGLPTFLLGSPGGIFMTANLVPGLHRMLWDSFRQGNMDEALKAHNALLPLVDALYTANHPGPLKNAMTFVGQPVGPARSPLQGAVPEKLEQARAALKAIEQELSSFADGMRR